MYHPLQRTKTSAYTPKEIPALDFSSTPKYLQSVAESLIEQLVEDYAELEINRYTACHSVAITLLDVFDEFIYNSTMPIALVRETRETGIHGLSDAFDPKNKIHPSLQNKLIHRLPTKFRSTARTMGKFKREYRRKPKVEQEHPSVCKDLLIELLGTDFGLTDKQIAEVCELVYSGPRTMGTIMTARFYLPEDQSGDDTGVYDMRLLIERLELSLGEMKALTPYTLPSSHEFFPDLCTTAP